MIMPHSSKAVAVDARSHVDAVCAKPAATKISPPFGFLAKQIFASSRFLRSRSSLRCPPLSAVPFERSSQPPKRSD